MPAETSNHRITETSVTATLSSVDPGTGISTTIDFFTASTGQFEAGGQREEFPFTRMIVLERDAIGNILLEAVGFADVVATFETERGKTVSAHIAAQVPMEIISLGGGGFFSEIDLTFEAEGPAVRDVSHFHSVLPGEFVENVHVDGYRRDAAVTGTVSLVDDTGPTLASFDSDADGSDAEFLWTHTGAHVAIPPGGPDWPF